MPDLTLTGEFELVVGGEPRPLPHMAERVVAYLALAGRSVARIRLAGILWPDTHMDRAAKNLRSLLWRLHGADVTVVAAKDGRLRLCDDVAVDVVELTALARQLIERPDESSFLRVTQLVAHAELLPDWDDEWVVADRERYRLVRLEALEASAFALLERGMASEAHLTALAAVQSDPLRESARRVLVQIQLAQGNIVEAINSYRGYSSLLRREFGVTPSREMERLVGPWVGVTPG